ncbi:hypothetical protein K502DRAFT_314897 [Neoconidiobolus thromboides FSU 785]|nr:hypothetical protein K502DRAFT_314897 [Neoconidiobolus thromboides FSU 785]
MNKSLKFEFPRLFLTLENKGSTARDHLANERTFLSWLRTSITLVTVGLAITQLAKMEVIKSSSYIFWVGILYSVMGSIFLVLGLSRYFRVQNQLLQQNFPSTRISLFLGSFLLLLFCVALTCFIGLEKLFDIKFH